MMKFLKVEDREYQALGLGNLDGIPQGCRISRNAAVEMAKRLPFAMDWIKYKGETFVGDLNVEETMRVGRPMIDLFHCLTRALNNNVIKTVQYDKKKFEPSELGIKW